MAFPVSTIFYVRLNKKNCLFPVTRPTLFLDLLTQFFIFIFLLFFFFRITSQGQVKDVATLFVPQTCQPSRFWRDSPAFLPDVPRPAKSWKGPAFLYEVGFFFARNL